MQCFTTSLDFLNANFESLWKYRLRSWITEISVSNRDVLTEILMTIWFAIAGRIILASQFTFSQKKKIMMMWNVCEFSYICRIRSVGRNISAALHYFIIMPSSHFTCVKHTKKTALQFGYCTQTYCNFDKKFNPCFKLKKLPKQLANHYNGCQLISRAKTMHAYLWQIKFGCFGLREKIKQQLQKYCHERKIINPLVLHL